MSGLLKGGMNNKRIILGIFCAVLTFSIGVGVAKFDFSVRQIGTPEEARTSSLDVPTQSINSHSPNELTFPDVVDTKTTVAGKFEIISTDYFKWQILLDGKEVFADEGLPPQVEKQITNKISPFDEVIVLTQETGTCCEFGRFWLLGMKSDGSFKLSQAIGDGFAYRPTISVRNNSLQITIRSGNTIHHIDGEPYLYGGTWILDNGLVRKVK